MPDKRRTTTVTAPDGSKAVSKTDRKNRIKKITYTDDMGNENGVERFSRTQRQKAAQDATGKYDDEDSIPEAKSGGIFKEVAASNAKRRRTPRGY